MTRYVEGSSDAPSQETKEISFESMSDRWKMISSSRGRSCPPSNGKRGEIVSSNMFKILSFLDHEHRRSSANKGGCCDKGSDDSVEADGEEMPGPDYSYHRYAVLVSVVMPQFSC